ncbi:MAG: hypothetical protein RhofKO_02320 [Rhodothermales bacterium]
MDRPILFVALLALITAPLATAQEVSLRPQTLATEVAHGGEHHETLERLTSPIGRAALEAFHMRKANGTLPSPAFKRMDPEVGDRMDFMLRQGSSLNFDTKTFELVGKGDRYYIWVDLDEMSNVDATKVAQLKAGLGDGTPAGSYNANAGIIENNEVVFGAPPNVDGDSKTDVVLFDLPSNIAGYFDPVDIAPDTNGSGFIGNGRDIIYIDSRFSPSTTLAVVAHEYQHLIHANYDQNEKTFINEGLSEWAEIMNGYPGRQPRYLGTAAELELPFWEWRGEGLDYQRAILFTTYIAERIGVLATGSITRDRLIGASGYTSVLNGLGTGLTLSDLTANFHLANIINDPNVGQDYAHLTEFSTVRATPQLSVDARTAQNVSEDSYPLAPGSVLYLEVLNVTNPRLEAGSASETPSSSEANRVKPYAVLETQHGSIRVEPMEYGTAQVFDGEFARATLVIAHVQPANPFALNVRYSASWNSQGQVEISTVSYDDGNVVRGSDNAVEAFTLGEGARHANKFTVPEGATLTGVSIAPYFENQFSGSTLPNTAPRNARVHIWADDGTGLPSERPEDELFTFDVEAVATNTVPGYTFTEVNLQAFKDQLAGLPETIHIGLSNIGTDANHMVMGVSNYNDDANGDSPSSLYLSNFCDTGTTDNCWAPFSSVTSSGEAIFENRVLPIRAEFTIGLQGTSNEDVSELPEQATLEQNYPNPFNPTSTIAFTLPASSDVTLTVYDLLGRPVATLADGTLAAGRHQMAVDAADWASGVYLYVLQTPTERISQTMHLLK